MNKENDILTAVNDSIDRAFRMATDKVSEKLLTLTHGLGELDSEEKEARAEKIFLLSSNLMSFRNRCNDLKEAFRYNYDREFTRQYHQLEESIGKAEAEVDTDKESE